MTTSVMDTPAGTRKVALELVRPPELASERTLEPMTVGLPFPCGAVTDPSRIALDGADGRLPAQCRALDWWPDGSIRWLLVDFQADVSARAKYEIAEVDAPLAPHTPSPLTVSACKNGIVVDTGTARFHIAADGHFPFAEVRVPCESPSDGVRTRLRVVDAHGTAHEMHTASIAVEELGAFRAVVVLHGTIGTRAEEPLLEATTRLHFFAGSPTVRFAVTLRNPRRAEHPGGIWTLGDAGSVLLRDASFEVVLPPASAAAEIRCSPEDGAPFEMQSGPFELYQDSSGGEHWNSSNHLNRDRRISTAFRGYQVRSAGGHRSGLRATPVVSLRKGSHQIAFAMQHFWQNFPKAIEATEQSLLVGLFPRQSTDLHEIQGGEQKTHTFHIAFGEDRVSPIPLDWCRSPTLARATPEWYCSSGAIPYLTPAASDPHVTYLQLTSAAIEGPDTFEHKREVVDEYGWRHFGDIYGDHEAVRHQGAQPLVSHYNNQYDAIAGMTYQFLRSGDARWWPHLNDLAAHVIDIDIYHTDRDKAAYNGGLFWHTVHYIDADTATHRSYPRAPHVSGGGPAAEHNYTTGLMLHFFLTGNPDSRQAAANLAQFVVNIDDGAKTVFRFLDRGCTGLATASASLLYHGPGRAGGNSLNALIDGHRLTRNATYLAKADQIIRRCVHPADDIAAHNLLDAERKWFYTMFLQSLGKYLDYKVELQELDANYAYARASLLHYARWMAEHEYPYLDKPDILEFPTETWAAQDMRKSEVFEFAAMHADGAERERFLERSDFFFTYSTTTLATMETRTLARPVILLLAHGFMHAFFKKTPGVKAPPPSSEPREFEAPVPFVAQKLRVKRRLLILAIVAGAVLSATAVLLLVRSA